jgi:hypothetical protein
MARNYDRFHTTFGEMTDEERSRKANEDPRMAMTTRIWGMTIPLFALSIPLIAITNSDSIILPMTVILGAAASTLGVWFAPQRELPAPSVDNEEIALMRRSIIELSEQVTYLQQIVEEQRLASQISKADVSVASVGASSSASAA